MNQNRKYWAKNDRMLLADKSREPAFTDDFKQCHIPIKKTFDVTEKEVNRHWSIEKDRKMRQDKVQERWTADVLKYQLPDGKRIMDCVSSSRPMETDYDPMYSSFSKNF